MVLCVPLTVMIVIVCARFEGSRPIAILLSQTGEVGGLSGKTGTTG